MKRTFIPRARLVSILGDQLIRDDVVGLLELVKNAYDADARTVEVSILNTARPDDTEIWVRDDGTGMDLNTIEQHWLQPASGHKETTKKAQKRSRLGRLPQGEKGVGRFAVQRLGRRLTVITRTEDNPQEIIIEIDWSQFEDEDRKLSEVEFDVNLRKPELFVDSSGTLIKMKGSRTTWTRGNIEKVHRYLGRMMSPFEGAKDFEIRLVCPDYPHFQTFSPAEITKQYHFRFAGSVNTAGVLNFDYHFRVPTYQERNLSQQTANLIQDCEHWGSPDRSPVCGPFRFEIFGWYRRPEIMNLTPDVSRGDIDSRCGIHVYRDGIRVLPYGESGDDWLELDRDRINRPDEKLGNKNLLGLVELRQDQNPSLKDKTNREGLVENQAFTDFMMLVKTCVKVLANEFQSERNLIKESLQTKRDVKRQELERKREELAKKLDTPTVIPPDDKPNGTGNKTEPQAQLHKEVVNILRESDRLHKEQQEAFETEREALLSLAGLGFTAERFAHEFTRLVVKAEDSFARIQTRLGETDADVMAVRSALDALRNEIRGLEPLMYVSRRKRNQTSTVMSAVENAVLLNELLADEERVTIKAFRSEDFSIRMNAGALTQVLNNLLDNAIYWTSRNRAGEDRIVEIEIREENSTVIVRDSGPGVADHVADRIFDPFVTQRSEGRGLGLWICRQVLAEQNCTLQLLPRDSSANPLGGAAFLIDLTRARVN